MEGAFVGRKDAFMDGLVVAPVGLAVGPKEGA
jgi:hypothetical protein